MFRFYSSSRFPSVATQAGGHSEIITCPLYDRGIPTTRARNQSGARRKNAASDLLPAACYMALCCSFPLALSRVSQGDNIVKISSPSPPIMDSPWKVEENVARATCC